ncbi:DNA-directed RNA polymerase III RPC2, partial [Toxoplasma gondii VAND]
MESRCSPSVEMTGKKRVAPAPAAVVAGEVDPLASLSPRLGGLKNWRDTTQNESEKTSGDASASSPSSSTRLRFPYGASVPSDRRIPYCRPPGGRSSASSRPSSSPSAAPSAVPPASPASLETREEGGRAKKSVRFASVPKKSADSSSSTADATVADPYASGKPVCTVPDKWRLLPAFFAAKGLVHQHIESYNFFVDTELQNILRAPSNRLVKSDVDPSFFIEFLNISVGTPRYEEGMILQRLTPRICRTREITYAAPVFVDAEYSKGDEIIRRKHVEIGSIPVMLRSRVCVLHGKDPQTLQRLGECPFDPGGYFIVKGTEKVSLKPGLGPREETLNANQQTTIPVLSPLETYERSLVHIEKLTSKYHKKTRAIQKYMYH